jgi:hypothetical protein
MGGDGDIDEIGALDALEKEAKEYDKVSIMVPSPLSSLLERSQLT